MRTGLLAVLFTLALAAPAAAAPKLVSVGSFDRPTYVTSPPKDGRVFVAEKGGLVKIVGRGTFLDARSLTDGSYEERGLLSLAFPPNYATSGLFDVFLTDKDTGDLKVLQFQRSANPDRANPTPVKTLLSIPHGPEYHNGGQLQFGPDGMLWVSTGDGHDSTNAQDTGSLLGKILRLDPATGGAASGNPHGRVWAYGLRNPWRFSFDRANGDLSIGDVGAEQWEEIDWAPSPNRGRDFNFGWPTCEGPDTGNQCPADPIVAHDHGGDGFCAIVGGNVVRDPGVPSLKGRYVYGDNCNTSLYSTTPRTGAGDRRESLTVAALSSFGEDACGHVYVASLTGYVARLQEGAASACTFGGADTAAPAVKVWFAGLKTALKRRRLLVRVRSNETCHATIGTRLKKVRRLGTRRRSLTANQRKTIKLKLTNALVRKIKRRGSVRIQVTVRATDAAGNTGAVVKRRRLKP